jgi:hypothetical protein
LKKKKKKQIKIMLKPPMYYKIQKAHDL